MTDSLRALLAEVAEERERQARIHPGLLGTQERAVSVLLEEVAEAILAHRPERRRAELVQVAAVALRWAEEEPPGQAEDVMSPDIVSAAVDLGDVATRINDGGDPRSHWVRLMYEASRAAEVTACLDHREACRAATIAIDLDGTLAQYDGWRGPLVIGNPIPGATHFVRALREQGWRIVIHSARFAIGPEAAEAVENWLARWGFGPGIELHVGPGKPVAAAYVDDRALYLRPQRETAGLSYVAALERLAWLMKEHRGEATGAESSPEQRAAMIRGEAAG